MNAYYKKIMRSLRNIVYVNTIQKVQVSKQLLQRM